MGIIYILKIYLKESIICLEAIGIDNKFTYEMSYKDYNNYMMINCQDSFQTFLGNIEINDGISLKII